jgi:hypothetical protein
MNSRTLLIALVLALAPLAAPAADFPGALKVTFRTTDCDGSTGMGSVDADRVSRIQSHSCPNGRKLKQVLVGAPGSYEAFTITDDEAVKLEAEIQRVMETRKRALEQTKPIVIER